MKVWLAFLTIATLQFPSCLFPSAPPPPPPPPPPVLSDICKGAVRPSIQNLMLGSRIMKNDWALEYGEPTCFERVNIKEVDGVKTVQKYTCWQGFYFDKDIVYRNDVEFRNGTTGEITIIDGYSTYGVFSLIHCVPYNAL